MRARVERLVLNPFEDCSDRSMLWMGLLAFLCMMAVSLWGDVLFDGIIQIHLGSTDGIKAVLGNVSNVFILTIGLFVLARILYAKVRVVDILNNVLIARIPILFAGLLTIPMGQLLPADLGKDGDAMAALQDMGQLNLLWIAVIAVILLCFIVYFFYLLVVGVKHSINSKKPAHAFLIVITVLVLDVIATFIYRGYFI